MQYKAKDVNNYISQLPSNKKESIIKLRATILDNLPEGFEETILYGMIGYVVPLSIYPKGYHVTPNLPLSFIGLAAQKNHIALYHSGIYMFPEILDWFEKEYSKQMQTKLDMGKSCIRFKNMQTVPYTLIGQLCSKLTVAKYLKRYEEVLNLNKSK